MFTQWLNGRIKRLTYIDLGVTKVCVSAFTLMTAKLWQPMLSLKWYWYGGVFIITYIYLMAKIFGPGND